MKQIKLILIILIVLSAITALSCGQQDGGLFYSLEKEAEIYNGTLPNDITIGSMEKNSGFYFIAAGKFMYIDETAANTVKWTEKNPDNLDDYLCYNMIMVSEKIYALFYHIDKTNVKLFSIDVSAPKTQMKWSSELEFAKILAGETVIDFELADTKLFVYTQNADKQYSVFSTNISGFAPDTADFSTIKTDLIVGGEFKVDYDGTNYWIVAGNKVFETNGTAAGTDKTPDISLSDYLLANGFRGIVCVDTDVSASGVEVFLTSKEGVMLKYISGAWKVLKSPDDEENGLFEPLYDIEYIKISNGDDVVDVIIAGSEAGYYEMQFGSSETFLSAENNESSLTTKNQFSSIKLSKNVILDFYFDEEVDDEKIFALCYNGGLWKNSFKKDISDRFWDIE